ncbi:MAG: hypothetical protein RIR45_1448, partial [Pseudomonadota bacterium]
VLGICYGMQAMAHQLGGLVTGGHKREFGHADVRAHGHTALLEGIQDYATPMGHGMLKVWMSHGDKVTELPHGFKVMASTDSCPIAGMAARQNNALQTAVTRIGANPVFTDVTRMNFAKDMGFTNTTGNQLGDLRTEVKNENFLMHF